MFDISSSVALRRSRPENRQKEVLEGSDILKMQRIHLDITLFANLSCFAPFPFALTCAISTFWGLSSFF